MSAIIKAGVIGESVEQYSLSPKIHKFWLDEYKIINGEYRAYNIAPDALEDFIRNLQANDFAGCNVTVPYKEKTYELLKKIGTVDSNAQAVGAVNTIIVAQDGGLRGINTDVFGFRENIRSYLLDSKKRKAVIYGSGGAAKAALIAISGLGFAEIVVVGRNQSVLSALSTKGYTTELWESGPRALKGADLVVNATSLGMVGKEPFDFDFTYLESDALVTDIVYTPLETEFLKAAKKRGNSTVDGLGMLLYQAADAFHRWFPLKEIPRVTQELRDTILTP